MTCRSACAAAPCGAAGRPCGQRPPTVRRNRGARSPCRVARRPRVALRNARAQNLPRQPAKHGIAAGRRMALRVLGWRRTGPAQQALLRAPARVGQAPTPSPGPIRSRANLRMWGWYCGGASVDPRAWWSIIHRRPSICRAQIPTRSVACRPPAYRLIWSRLRQQWLVATTGGTIMTRANLIAALCTLAMAAAAGSDAWSQETLKVAIPQRGAWDAGVAELGQRGGIFKKHGLNLEILYVQAGPESIQAVIGGSMDIATAAGVSAAVGTFAKGAPIRILGSEMIGAPDLYWYVPANSPIQKIEDFNGKTVAYSLTGSSSHAALLALIAQYKLTAKPTSTGNIASTITQTMTGQVDVGFGAAPFGLDLAEDGKTGIIATRT